MVFGCGPPNSLKIFKIMDWIPIVLVTFKVLVLGTGMFFAIKWHYDQKSKGRKRDMRAVLLAGGKAAAVFVLSLISLGFATFVFSRMLGLDLTWP